jgi:beta-glucosidase
VAAIVQIRDVVYDPPGADIDNEYVLLANVGTTEADLTGWRLRDAVAPPRAPHTFVFPRFVLAAGAQARVHTGIGVNDADDLFWRRRWAVWNNTGDTAILTDRGGHEVDRFTWTGRGPQPTRFPEGFLWGAATAGYQVEGSTAGNDWDFFTSSAKIAERIRRNTQRVGLDVRLGPPGSAVDHFNLAVLGRDLDRAAALGLNAYRFSIEWARLEPADTGTAPLTDGDVDQAALAYYSAVVDAVRARGMRPVVTLNHLTLPLWVLKPPERTSILGETMTDAGFDASLRGWENPDVIDRFVRLVEYVVPKLKDRVDWWITINEPVGSMIGVGYLGGVWPPGFTLDGSRAKKAYFNLLRAHCRAYDAVKRLDDVDADGDGQAARVGFAHAMMRARGAPGSAAANAWRQFDYFYNWHMLDVVLTGEIDTKFAWPSGDRNLVIGDEAADWLGVDRGAWRPRADFVGLNYYRSVAVWWEALVELRANFSGGAFDNELHDSDAPHGLVNDLGWEMNPDGIRFFIDEIHRRYGARVLVTENGLPETVDRNRGPALVGHLRGVLDAIEAGATVDGYLHWSLLDNFEWQEGYRPEAHFGLFAVDRATAGKPRHLTEGGLVYARVVAQNGIAGLEDSVGAVNALGTAVRAPRRGGGLVYAGIVPAPIGSLVLHVAPGRTGDDLVGLLQYPARDRWVAVRDLTWTAAGGVLRFRHDRQGEVPARRYDLTASAGRLAGDCVDEGTGASTPIDLPRLGLAGVWASDQGHLGFSRVGWDEPWQMRMLTRGDPMWQPGPGVTFDAATGSVTPAVPHLGLTATVVGDSLTGNIEVVGLTLPVSAERAPSPLPFE